MTREIIVGFVFFLGLALLGIFTFTSGLVPWQAPVKMEIFFSGVTGLEVGSQVLVDGLPRGKVVDMDLDPKGVRVVLALQKKLELREKDRIAIEEKGMLGVAVVAVRRGDPSAPLLQEPFIGQAPTSLGMAISELQGMIQENRVKIRALIANVEEATGALQTGPGLLRAVLHEEQVTKDFRNLVRDVKDTAGSASRIARQVERGPGAVHSVIYKPLTARQLEDAVSDLRRAAADIRLATGQINDGKSLLSRLIKDEALGEKFDGIAGDVKAVTGKIARGEGTVGKLVNDPALYDQVVEAVSGLKETIEDVREQVPISSFTSILFSFF